MNTPLDALRVWEIPGQVSFQPGKGNLLRLVVTTKLAEAHVYLHGAHVTHYRPAGQSPVLFTSEQSKYAHDKAIRGGVPVIFPWFGANAAQPDLPMHGFARTRHWDVEGVEKWPDDTVEVILRLVSDDATRALWPHDFVLRHRIFIGRQLEMALEVENWSEGPFTFEEALHTYVAVRDVRQARVSGLAGIEYLDKVDALQRKKQGSEPIALTGETDRVYLNTTGDCVIDDPVGDRKLRVSKEGSATTVVWNPWVEKAKAMSDFGDEEWPGMLCVETANAGENAVTLGPTEAHVMRAVVGLA
jgi:glucose-6-phosphate 1-epimerase